MTTTTTTTTGNEVDVDGDGATGTKSTLMATTKMMTMAAATARWAVA